MRVSELVREVGYHVEARAWFFDNWHCHSSHVPIILRLNTQSLLLAGSGSSSIALTCPHIVSANRDRAVPTWEFSPRWVPTWEFSPRWVPTWEFSPRWVPTWEFNPRWDELMLCDRIISSSVMFSFPLSHLLPSASTKTICRFRKLN